MSIYYEEECKLHIKTKWKGGNDKEQNQRIRKHTIEKVNKYSEYSPETEATPVI